MVYNVRTGRVLPSAFSDEWQVQIYANYKDMMKNYIYFFEEI